MADRQVNAGVVRRGRFVQTENAVMTYTANYAGLHASAIIVSAWSTEDGGVTLLSNGNTDHTAWVVVLGDTGRYRLVNKVTLADATVDETYFDIEIIDNSNELRERNYQ